ncbi:hypothetical protein AVEN_30024-1 [Araneus ventricosus]|uniref:Uncharacterized protein n=1 Tax=Araneus ventricosus TaxID=182803 RepID=A0A4Y2DYP5_ARAVE|nr:hypothetical protein AVEN_30024-1 [Araneus ventricosus]
MEPGATYSFAIHHPCQDERLPLPQENDASLEEACAHLDVPWHTPTARAATRHNWFRLQVKLPHLKEARNYLVMIAGLEDLQISCLRPARAAIKNEPSLAAAVVPQGGHQ